MIQISMFQKLRRTLRAFRASRGGNVAVTFALASLPMAGLVGAAVDYSHANSVRTSMQMALDSTALMLSKDAATLTQSQLNSKATAYFTALYNKPEVTNIVVTPTYTTSGGSAVTVAGTGVVKASFSGVIGMPNITINGTSTVTWGMSRLRVALVLDNTGSMADNGKISALISATNSLLNQLKAAVTTNGDVYVSIVPFVKDVNVGASNYVGSWVDWTDWDANNGSCSGSLFGGWGGWGGGFGGGSTKSSCSGTWTPNNHNTWNGCVTDRGKSNAPDAGNYDTNVVAPTTSITATLWPAEQYDPCPQAVMPLSYNWSGMTSLVNSMSPGGNTNQAVGLALGWMSLTGGGPFPTPPVMDPNYKYTQVIILLTDGLNTQDRWYTDQNSIDARQTLTCNNIKSAGITLYTIQVNTGGDPTSTLLQNCASDAKKFFLLTQSNQIISVFTQIGTALSQLRISK